MSDKEKNLKTYERASLALGILSIIIHIILPYGVIPIVLGIISTCLGNVSRKNGGPIAGFICGIVGIALGLVGIFEALLIHAGLRPFVHSIFDLFHLWRM